MKKSLIILSFVFNIIFIVLALLYWFLLTFNSPSYDLGRLEKDINVGGFMSDSAVFFIPKGITVTNVSERGIGAIGQFENERFSIVFTSDDFDLVNYNLPEDSLNVFGNYYSVSSINE